MFSRCVQKLLKTSVFIEAFLLSFAVETLQYFNIITVLGLENSSFARTVIGTSFAWLDLLTYIIGIGIVLLVEKIRPKKIQNRFRKSLK